MAFEAVSGSLVHAQPSLTVRFLKVGLALLFITGVILYTLFYGNGHASLILVIAAAVGAYMAMGIGANDVANNVGPAVGSASLHPAR